MSIIRQMDESRREQIKHKAEPIDYIHSKSKVDCQTKRSNVKVYALCQREGSHLSDVQPKFKGVKSTKTHTPLVFKQVKYIRKAKKVVVERLVVR